MHMFAVLLLEVLTSDIWLVDLASVLVRQELKRHFGAAGKGNALPVLSLVAVMSGVVRDVIC